jgi:uncharacterized protein involved in exopolysaccharide biosynthesis
MELIDLLRVVRRWLWLIVLVVVVTELALWLGTRSAAPSYAATVRLQISAPQREEVAAYDTYRFNPRDEIAVAINNLVELLQSEDVYQQTASQLGLDGEDALYTLDAGRASDADFINVTVEARSPELAAEIANTHVGIAIAYYGELRAQSTLAEKDLFAGQLQVAEEELWAAEKALADFRAQNGIYSLESQMSTQQRLIEQLQLERDQRLLEQVATVTDPVGEIDVLIAQRRKELDQYATLAPQYFILTQNVEQARTVYQDLLSKYNQAELIATEIRAATFIQVIKPAYATVGSESSWSKLAVLALAGSLGLGVMLAFLLQYLSSFQAASETVPVSDHKTQLRGRRKTVTQSRASEVPESDHATPLFGHAGREIWKRIRNIFRRHDPLYERADLDVEQEPTAMQSRHDSTETKAG